MNCTPNVHSECKLTELLDLVKLLADFYDKLGELENFLSHATSNVKSFVSGSELAKKKKILILGVCNNGVKIKDILGICKKYGWADNVDLVEYNEVTNFNVRQLEYTDVYSHILIGATPHMAKGIGEASSLLQYLRENKEKFPRVHILRKENGTLGITKTSLHKVFSQLSSMEML